MSTIIQNTCQELRKEHKILNKIWVFVDLMSKKLEVFLKYIITMSTWVPKSPVFQIKVLKGLEIEISTPKDKLYKYSSCVVSSNSMNSEIGKNEWSKCNEVQRKYLFLL